MVCFGFWFGEVRALIIAYNMLTIFLSGQLIPIQLFPDGLRQFVMNSPFRFMVDFPVSIATTKSIDPYFLFQGIVTQICWCIIMYGIGKFIYYLGVKQYEAFGA
tara:strand:- start:337 stop:648 length:312 start_codon:yes stop_codon:yes gene_type:complete